MAIIIKDGKVGREEEKEASKWFSRIKLGEKFREGENRKSAWKNMKAFYRNQFKDDIVSVPLIYAHGRQLVPFLYFKSPVIECTPLQRGFGKKAKVLEAVDNMLIREMRVKEQLKLIIQDTYLYDYGIRKVGYDSEFGYDPTGSLWKELFEELGITNQVSPEELIEYNTFIIKEFPFFLRVPPQRFLLDPDVEGPTFDTAKWCAEEFYRSLEDVLADDRYDVPKDLKATHMLIKDGTGNYVISPTQEGYSYVTPNPSKKSDVERVRLHEIWDKEAGRVYVLADGHKGFLRDVEDVWGLDGFFPYDRLCFNPVSDEHYSTSDAMYVEKQQLEYNDCITQEQFHRRKENLKILVEENSMSDEEIEKMNSGSPMVVAKVRAGGGNIQSKIMTFTGQMSRDIFQARSDIRADMTDVLAMGKNQMTQELGKRKTASEAMLINQYTELRADERRDIVADFLERSMSDVNTLVFNFWDTPDVIRLVGPEGEVWEDWTGEDLRGKYAVQIVPNSTVPHTKKEYQQKVEKLYQMLAGNPFVNLKEMTRILLDSYEEFDTSKLLLTQPGEQPSMADFRPGKAKMQDEEQSRINIPEIPEVAMENQPGGGGEGA